MDGWDIGFKGAAGVAGAIGGGLAAGEKSRSDRKTTKEYLRQQEIIRDKIAAQAGMREGELNSAYAPQLQGFDENSKQYFDELKNADFSKYDVTDPGEYNGPSMAEMIAQSWNPQAQSMIAAAGNAVQGSAANSGNLFSGITAGNIANATAAEQGKQYEAARAAGMQQYGQKYKEFADKFDRSVTASGVNKGNYTSGINARGTLYGAQSGAFEQKQTGLNDIRSAADAGTMQSQGETAQAAAKKAGTPGYWSSFASGALSGLSSGLGGK